MSNSSTHKIRPSTKRKEEDMNSSDSDITSPATVSDRSFCDWLVAQAGRSGPDYVTKTGEPDPVALLAEIIVVLGRPKAFRGTDLIAMMRCLAENGCPGDEPFDLVMIAMREWMDDGTFFALPIYRNDDPDEAEQRARHFDELSLDPTKEILERDEESADVEEATCKR